MTYYELLPGLNILLLKESVDSLVLDTPLRFFLILPGLNYRFDMRPPSPLEKELLADT